MPTTVQLPTVIETAVEWLVRKKALRAAVAERDRAGAGQKAAIEQTHLLLEVARRVAEPAETRHALAPRVHDSIGALYVGRRAEPTMAPPRAQRGNERPKDDCTQQPAARLA